MDKYHNNETTSNALQKGFSDNKTHIKFVNRTMTIITKIDNRTTSFNTRKKFVITEKIIPNEAAADGNACCNY